MKEFKNKNKETLRIVNLFPFRLFFEYKRLYSQNRNPISRFLNRPDLLSILLNFFYNVVVVVVVVSRKGKRDLEQGVKMRKDEKQGRERKRERKRTFGIGC